MTSEDALSTVGVGESSSDNKVSWPLSPAWLMNLLFAICTGILTGGPLEAVDELEEEAEEGEVAFEVDELSDCVKLLRLSSFSRVRNPSILADLGRLTTKNGLNHPALDKPATHQNWIFSPFVLASWINWITRSAPHNRGKRFNKSWKMILIGWYCTHCAREFAINHAIQHMCMTIDYQKHARPIFEYVQEVNWGLISLPKIIFCYSLPFFVCHCDFHTFAIIAIWAIS